MTTNYSLRSPTIILTLRDLASGPATGLDVAAALRIARRTALQALRALRLARKVHIVGWERTRGSPRAVFALGPGQDAPRPKPLSKDYREMRARYGEHIRARNRAYIRRTRLGWPVERLNEPARKYVRREGA